MPPICDEIVLKCLFTYLMKRYRTLRTGLVEEKGRKIVKAIWGYSFVGAMKAGGQFCNIPPRCDEMVLKSLKCLFTYLIKR